MPRRLPTDVGRGPAREKSRASQGGSEKGGWLVAAGVRSLRSGLLFKNLYHVQLFEGFLFLFNLQMYFSIHLYKYIF